MNARRMTVLAAVVLGLAVFGCNRNKPAGGGGDNSSGGQTPTDGDNPAFMTEKLTDAEFKAHLDVLRGLQEVSGGEEKDPNDMQQTAEVTAYLASKGTTWPKFMKTHMKVASAFAAMGFRDGIAKAEAEGAPTFAINMMKMAGAAYKNVPDENVELARKYQKNLEELGVEKEGESGD